MRYQIRHARVQFGGDVILQDVNFEVHDREKIAVVPGSAFGDSGEGFVRISYSYSQEHLNLALKRIGRFVATL